MNPREERLITVLVVVVLMAIGFALGYRAKKCPQIPYAGSVVYDSLLAQISYHKGAAEVNMKMAMIYQDSLEALMGNRLDPEEETKETYEALYDAGVNVVWMRFMRRPEQRPRPSLEVDTTR